MPALADAGHDAPDLAAATAVPTPKLAGYAVLAAGGLLGSVAFHSPVVGALAAPFAFALVVGLALRWSPDLRVTARRSTERAFEGDEVAVEVTVEAPTVQSRVEVVLVPTPGFDVGPGRANMTAFPTRPGRPSTTRVTGCATRWGALHIVDIVVRTRDRMGLFVREAHLVSDDVVRVYPRVDSLRRFARPQDTQVFAGNQTARVKAEGVEFADLRPFVAGDRMRDVNWRVTARRGEMWVNQRHPDRNADVVLFLDAFIDEHLDDAVRAATMLVAQYLHGRDRVGLVSFGGTVRWLTPAGGERQLYRMIDALIESQVFENLAPKNIEVLPGRVLPPRAMILALSSLEDSRSVGALHELCRRGRDVAVVEIVPRLDPPAAAPAGAAEVDALARRLWHLQRRAVRDRLERAGATVVEWREDLPDLLPAGTRDRIALDVVGEELRTVRRRSLRAG